MNKTFTRYATLGFLTGAGILGALSCAHQYNSPVTTLKGPKTEIVRSANLGRKTEINHICYTPQALEDGEAVYLNGKEVPGALNIYFIDQNSEEGGVRTGRSDGKDCAKFYGPTTVFAPVKRGANGLWEVDYSPSPTNAPKKN